jgi:hypothetical protein
MSDYWHGLKKIDQAKLHRKNTGADEISIPAVFFCADPEADWIALVEEEMDYQSIARTQDADHEGWSEYYNS